MTATEKKKLMAEANKVLKGAQTAITAGKIVDGVTLQNFDYEVFPEDQPVEMDITNIAHKDLERGLNAATGKPWVIFQPMLIGVVEGKDVQAPVGIDIVNQIVEDGLDTVTLTHKVFERKGKEIHKLILE